MLSNPGSNLKGLVFDDRVYGYWFPPYKKYIPHRIKVLRLALKDLERIKEEYGKD